MSFSHANAWDLPYTSQRMPVLAENMVCTSQPLATNAALQILAKGGNAIDAALAAATTLTVTEPCMNGIGGDLFAIVWDGAQLHGLNASGRAPAAWNPEHFSKYESMPKRGWDSVTVPGVVSGWRALSDKFGSLPFADLFDSAIHYARNGYLVAPIAQRQWAGQVAELSSQPGFIDGFAPGGKAPAAGTRFISPGQADTLTAIAQSGGEDFYHGKIARAIADHARATGGLMTEADLAAHFNTWEIPISTAYGDIELHEIGPSGQGIGALIALGILEQSGIGKLPLDSTEYFHAQIEAMKLSFADIYRYVADPEHMQGVTAAELLDPAYLAERAKLLDPTRANFPGPGKIHHGGTTYLTVADSKGMMVSLIQSNFKGFGSGVVIPDTGIAMQNRGWGFNLMPGHPNQVGPNKRPFHTIIPGFLTRGGKPLMSFGVMGGSLQAQGHMQVAIRIGDHGQNPQAAIDAPRWRIDDDNITVAVEWNFPPEAIAGLRALGHKIVVAPRHSDEFGGSQAIMRLDGGEYLGGSDHRKDGHAAGY